MSLRAMAASLRRPYTVRLPMLLFVLLVPFYIFIAQFVREGGVTHVPELALDRAIPLWPAWTLVYGSLYFSLIVLPVLVVREDDHIRRTIYAYLTIWLTAYTVFWWYPTAAPRGDDVPGSGFGVWALRGLYGMDPPFNCLPSLHVAHSFVSAFAIQRVHARVGIAAIIGAALVGLSTLFVKQHYVLDVVTGAMLAGVAYAIFLRGSPREKIADEDRRLAPAFAAATLTLSLMAVAGFWVAYQLTG